MDLGDLSFPGFADDEGLSEREEAPGGRTDEIEADWRSVLRPVRASDLAGLTVPPREWVVDEWIPERCPVLFTGPGGVGKTLLAMQLAVALALGRDWLGLQTRRKRVLLLLCEDDEGEIHRRLSDIAWGYGVAFEDLHDLVYLCRVGQESTLIGRTRNGLIGPTDLHGSLGEMIADEGIEVLIGDNARHLFDIEEQKGPDVTKAINLFHGLMLPTGGSSILLHHPNKAGTSDFAGSVAWEAAVRSRLFLSRVVPQDGDGERGSDLGDLRRLSKGKANMAALDSFDLRYDAGFFRRLESPPDPRTSDPLTVAAYQDEVDKAFLSALDALTAQGRNVSHSPRAANYAPKEIKRLCPTYDRRDLEAAMERLFAAGVIAASQKIKTGKDRHAVIGIARVHQPQCDNHSGSNP